MHQYPLLTVYIIITYSTTIYTRFPGPSFIFYGISRGLWFVYIPLLWRKTHKHKHTLTSTWQLIVKTLTRYHLLCTTSFPITQPMSTTSPMSPTDPMPATEKKRRSSRLPPSLPSLPSQKRLKLSYERSSSSQQPQESDESEEDELSSEAESLSDDPKTDNIVVISTPPAPKAPKVVPKPRVAKPRKLSTPTQFQHLIHPSQCTETKLTIRLSDKVQTNSCNFFIRAKMLKRRYFCSKFKDYEAFEVMGFTPAEIKEPKNNKAKKSFPLILMKAFKNVGGIPKLLKQ